MASVMALRTRVFCINCTRYVNIKCLVFSTPCFELIESFTQVLALTILIGCLSIVKALLN